MHCAFDFDGTIADSKPIYYKAVDLYSRQHGLKAPGLEEKHIVFGHPNPPIIFKGWGTIDAFKKHLLNIYEITDGLICDQPSDMPLFDGIEKLLKELHGELILSIVTSRSLKPIQALIKHHNIERFFKTIRSDQDIIERGYRGKPFPDKLNCVLREMGCPADQSVMIGDTLMDMAMAKNAGTKAVGVLWGYHDEDTLRKHGADHVVQTPQKLHETINTLLKK